MRPSRSALVVVAVVAVLGGSGWSVITTEADKPTPRVGSEAGKPTPRLGSPGLVVGVTANALDDDMRGVTARVRSVGVRWMREDFRWPVLEPRRGQMSFARYDRLMVATASRGVRVLPLLLESPRWTGASRVMQLPPSLPAWTRFVQRTLQRYGPGGAFWRAHPELDASLAPRVWEIWNEAYLPQFAYPRPDPARYAQLVDHTVRAGRAVSPSVRYLVSAETGYRAPDGSLRDWLGDMARAVPKLGEVVDGLAVHPYSVGGPANTATARETQFDRLEDFGPTLQRLGVGRKPLWITEFGWSTCAERPPCETRAKQRRYFAEALERVATRYRDRVAAVFAYRLDDLDVSGSRDFQAGFGVAERGGRKKPSWEVLRSSAIQSESRR